MRKRMQFNLDIFKLNMKIYLKTSKGSKAIGLFIIVSSKAISNRLTELSITCGDAKAHVSVYFVE